MLPATIVDIQETTAVNPKSFPAPSVSFAIPDTTYPTIISGIKNDRNNPKNVLKVLKILTIQSGKNCPIIYQQ